MKKSIIFLIGIITISLVFTSCNLNDKSGTRSKGSTNLLERQFIAKASKFENQVFAAYETEKSAFTQYQIVLKTQAEIATKANQFRISELKALTESVADEQGLKQGDESVSKVMALVSGWQTISDPKSLEKEMLIASKSLYAEYKNQQDLRIDLDRQYRDWLQGGNRGFIAESAGYPTVKYVEAKLDQAVQTETGKKVYEDKLIKEEDMDIFK
jgi:hypothetical protein